MEEESEEVEGNHRSHLYLFRVCILRRVFRFFFVLQCRKIHKNAKYITGHIWS